MFSLVVTCCESETELLSAELWERGAAGIEEISLPGSRCRLRAYFEAADGLEEAFAPYGARLETVPDADWELAARQAWPAFPLGRRLYLAPEWDESPTPQGRLRLIVHPGQALGTGAHPATQLCLEALDESLVAGETVLDVGTGSAILLSAALLLGAGRAAGCDIDFDSIRIARRNLQSDGRIAGLFCGSARAVRPKAFDVIIANINTAAHESLAEEYARLAPRRLILSGFPERDSGAVEAALRRRGYAVMARLGKEDWRCLILCGEDRS